jgi:putative methanogen marker protein 4
MLEGTIPRRIGVGVLEDPSRIVVSIERYTKLEQDYELCVYTVPTIAESISFPCSVSSVAQPEQALIDDLYSGRLCAAVRGTLASRSTLSYLKKVSGCESLERIVLLETPDGHLFFMGPVGVDEGYTISEKEALIKKGKEFAAAFSLSSTVGVLSGGRHDDYGRHPRVDASLDDAHELSKRLGVTDFGILIEDAVRECGFIVAPDGISGNLIFRTLVLVGGGCSHGAPVVNLNRIFIDTSRANPDYACSFVLAGKLSMFHLFVED